MLRHFITLTPRSLITSTRAMSSSMKMGRLQQVDLFTGWPNPSLLPPKSLNEASGAVLPDTRVSTSVLSYGPDEGYLPLRKEVAKWLNAFYSPKSYLSYDRICITGGASQNLANVLQTFTDPMYTRNIWMVSPTYFLACRIFDDSGFAGRLRAVPEDEEGIDLAYLEERLKISEEEAQTAGNLEPKFKPPRPWRKIYKQVIYTVPTFANPSGKVMSLARRKGLVRLARKYDALIVTDDVYDVLLWPSSPEGEDQSFDTACQPRMVDVDRELDGGPIDSFGNAVSNGSFSKIVAPGCRTGWAEGTEAFAWGLSQTGSSRSGGCPSHLVASFIAKMLETNTLQDHIRNQLIPAYARRYYKLMGAIESLLVPLAVTMPQPDKSVAGGYFIWLRLPEPLEAEEVAKKALHEEGLIISDGPKYRVTGDDDNKQNTFDGHVRLCFAWEEENLLEEGVRRLAIVIRKELDSKK